MAAIGHPLLGDSIYGGDDKFCGKHLTDSACMLVYLDLCIL